MPQLFTECPWLYWSGAILCAYVAVGVLLCTAFMHNVGFVLKVEKVTYPVVDSLYLIVITICTIGYGDILLPTTPMTRAIFGIYGLVGNLLLCHFVFVFEGHVMAWLTDISEDAEETMCVRLRRFLGSRTVSKAFVCAVVVVLVGFVGIMVTEYAALAAAYDDDIRGFKKFLWVSLDAFYLAISTITTTGYGDVSFETVGGRLFASVYMPAAVFSYVHCVTILVERCKEVGSAWTANVSFTMILSLIVPPPPPPPASEGSEEDNRPLLDSDIEAPSTGDEEQVPPIDGAPGPSNAAVEIRVGFLDKSDAPASVIQRSQSL